MYADGERSGHASDSAVSPHRTRADGKPSLRGKGISPADADGSALLGSVGSRVSETESVRIVSCKNTIAPRTGSLSDVTKKYRTG